MCPYHSFPLTALVGHLDFSLNLYSIVHCLINFSYIGNDFSIISFDAEIIIEPPKSIGRLLFGETNTYALIFISSFPLTALVGHIQMDGLGRQLSRLWNQLHVA